MIKCNPRHTPVEPMVSAGHTAPRWCVADNYRTRLMRPGQRVLLWVTTRPDRGIWGVGRITGDVAVADGRHRVPVHIPLLPEPLTAAQLRTSPDLASLEVFRVPVQSNPSWVTVAEMTVIDALLPDSVQ
ncbi:hypothetical protein MOBUDSM44075_04994 [Mycolicibacterium obuense]|uniref:EVE domain-containing protein n=2 Tax=Mycolicibacterium obuense TaxID=1807 RepID=A0A0J6VJE8_9MYCO|nr:hypothetical protein MOBUDSM44075_04994 [Mycolicibacterium obuense]